MVLRILVRGLWKRDGVWIWDSAQQLNISKWRDSKPDGNDACAEISKNGGLFNSISCCDKNATFARCSEGRSHSNRKVNYELKRYSLVIVS